MSRVERDYYMAGPFSATSALASAEEGVSALMGAARASSSALFKSAGQASAEEEKGPLIGGAPERSASQSALGALGLEEGFGALAEGSTSTINALKNRMALAPPPPPPPPPCGACGRLVARTCGPYCPALPQLSYRQRLVGFVLCFCAGMFLSLTSLTSFTSLVLGNPKPFATKYSLGNCLSIGNSSIHRFIRRSSHMAAIIRERAGEHHHRRRVRLPRRPRAPVRFYVRA